MRHANDSGPAGDTRDDRAVQYKKHEDKNSNNKIVIPYIRYKPGFPVPPASPLRSAALRRARSRACISARMHARTHDSVRAHTIACASRTHKHEHSGTNSREGARAGAPALTRMHARKHARTHTRARTPITHKKHTKYRRAHALGDICTHTHAHNQQMDTHSDDAHTNKPHARACAQIKTRTYPQEPHTRTSHLQVRTYTHARIRTHARARKRTHARARTPAHGQAARHRARRTQRARALRCKSVRACVRVQTRTACG